MKIAFTCFPGSKLRQALGLLALSQLVACKMNTTASEVPPRMQKLTRFNPHVNSFECETEAPRLPPVDAQANDWLREARALEDPSSYIEEPDYKKTWQPWMHTEHPMRSAINNYWRQAWLVAGQRFPDPQLDWMLDVAADDIAWHLMDGVGVDICPA